MVSNRDISDAEIHFYDTGHFALATHESSVQAPIRASCTCCGIAECHLSPNPRSGNVLGKRGPGLTARPAPAPQRLNAGDRQSAERLC